MRLRVVLALVLAVLLCGTARAGPRLWDVYSTSDRPFVNVIVAGYESDSLVIMSVLGRTAIHQDSIKLIQRRNEAHPELGILGLVIGGIVGGATTPEPEGLAVLFAPAECVYRVLIGGVVGGLFGVAIGSAAGGDTEYRLDRMSPEGKRKVLSGLFSKPKLGRRPRFCPTCPGEGPLHSVGDGPNRVRGGGARAPNVETTGSHPAGADVPREAAEPAE